MSIDNGNGVGLGGFSVLWGYNKPSGDWDVELM